jgi:hypothetical protein
VDIRDRFVGAIRQPIVWPPETVQVDLTELVLRLLLTDTLILKTGRLLEIDHLVKAFGIAGLELLLESGKLRLTCEAFTLGYRAPADSKDPHDFEFLTVREGERAEYLRDCVANVARLQVKGSDALVRDCRNTLRNPRRKKRRASFAAISIDT